MSLQKVYCWLKVSYQGEESDPDTALITLFDYNGIGDKGFKATDTSGNELREGLVSVSSKNPNSPFKVIVNQIALEPIMVNRIELLSDAQKNIDINTFAHLITKDASGRSHTRSIPFLQGVAEGKNLYYSLDHKTGFQFTIKKNTAIELLFYLL